MPSTAAHFEVKEVHVALGSRSYHVEVGEGLLSTAGSTVLKRLPGRKKGVILTETTVGPLYADLVLKNLLDSGIEAHIITVPAGEKSKSLTTAQDVCSQMARMGLDRKSFLLALGGGVIGDLGGFCAGIYQRGIPYLQVPTTVLSQVDSSVGGKTGVNLPDAKNMVGVFHQPIHVLADTTTLATLKKRDWNEGFAEIIKHACIRDAAMLPLIEQVASGQGNLTELIRRNVAIKAKVVEEDEHETLGIRALLNFGHTLGHAIEAAAGYGQLLHGEAISLGLRAAAELSTLHSTLEKAQAARIVSLLQQFELPVVLPDGFDGEEIIRISRMDKKVERGGIRFVLLKSLGEAYVSQNITEDHMRAAIQNLRLPT